MARLALIFILVIIPQIGFNQTWNWSNQIGNNSTYWTEYGKVVSDGTNSYLIGRFGGTLYLQTDTITTVGANDLFIVKYNSVGQEQWVRSFGGNNSVNNQTEDIDGVFDPISNSIYITGIFYQSMTLGSTTLYSGSYSDIFLAKLDLNGNFIWAKKAGGIDDDQSSNIAVEPDGDIIISGECGSSGTFGSYNVTGNGFMARYSSAGSCKWAKSFFSGIEATEINVAFIGTDMILGCGFSGTATIDTATFSSTNGSFDGVLARCDSAGKLIWSKSFGQSGLDAISAVKVDSNEIYITGGFKDTLKIGSTYIYNSSQDVFVIRVNSSGNIVWAQKGNCTGSGTSGGTSLDVRSNVVAVTGLYYGSCTFGSQTLQAPSNPQSFVVTYTTSGIFSHLTSFGPAVGNKVVLDNQQRILTTGSFNSSLTLGANNYTGKGGNDIYIGKLDFLLGNSKLISNGTNENLEIFSNPNNGSFDVKIPSIFLSGDFEVTIYNELGLIAYQTIITTTDSQLHFDVSAPAKGLYFVTVKNAEAKVTGKVIFE